MTSSSPKLVMPEIDWGFDSLEDMAELLETLEGQGEQCVQIRYKGGLAWLVLGYDNISQVLRDETDIPASHFFKTYMDTVGFSLFHLEGDEHKAYKTAVLSRLSPMVARRMTEMKLIPVADRIIDDFGSSREVEFISSYGRRYAFNIMSQLLGVKIAREDEFRVLSMVGELSQIQDPHATREELRERALVAIKGTNELLRPEVEKRRVDPKDDLISFIMGLDINGRKLNDEEVLDFARSIYEGGADSVGLQLGNILNLILARPEIKEVLINEPEKRAAAIEDLIRLEPVTGLISRLTAKDTVIAGTTIPAESRVLLGVPGGNRNETYFPNAGTFSLEKRKRPVLSFGAGVRMCPGQHLARQELRVSLDRLLDRLPGLRLVGEPGRQIGTQGRWLRDGLLVRFDDILPADQVPTRL